MTNARIYAHVTKRHSKQCWCIAPFHYDLRNFEQCDFLDEPGDRAFVFFFTLTSGHLTCLFVISLGNLLFILEKVLMYMYGIGLGGWALLELTDVLLLRDLLT